MQGMLEPNILTRGKINLTKSLYDHIWSYVLLSSDFNAFGAYPVFILYPGLNLVSKRWN